MKKILLQTPIKIWYKPHGNPKILWPIIDIRLEYDGISLPQTVRSLVDSGASHSILHPVIAEALGFDLKKLGAPKRGGVSVSGNYESWILPELISVDIYGYSFSFKFTVINNPNLIWGCILGEDTIFQVSKLDFSKFKGYFEVRLRSDIN